MKYFLLALLAFTVSFTSGCAYVSSLSTDLPGKVDTLSKQQKYGEALSILKFIKPTHPHYAELKQREKHIIALSEKLAKKQIARARKYERKGQWKRALAIYQSALEKIPQHRGLNQAYQAFLTHRNAKLQKLEQALILNRAQWLVDNTPVQKEFSRTLANAEDRYSELKDFHRQVEDTSEKLVQCVNVNLQKNNNAIMQRCLLLAEKLAPGKINKALRAKAHAQLEKTKHARQRRRDILTRTLIAELKQGYSHENLLRARKQLDTFKGKKNIPRKTARLNAELKNRYRSGVKQGIEAGRKLYSDGKITEAVQIWKSLLAIDRENHKLEAHINRAKRVLQNLQKLSSETNPSLPPLSNK